MDKFSLALPSVEKLCIFRQKTGKKPCYSFEKHVAYYSIFSTYNPSYWHSVILSGRIVFIRI